MILIDKFNGFHLNYLELIFDLQFWHKYLDQKRLWVLAPIFVNSVENIKILPKRSEK